MKRILNSTLLLLIFTWSCRTTKTVKVAPEPLGHEDALEKIEVPEPKQYKGSRTRLHDLHHTKLDLSFDWDSAFVFGEASLLLSPYYHSTDQLVLDARGFDVHKLSLRTPTDSVIELKYTYDSLQLHISLDKSYSKTDTFNIFIKYTAKPNQLRTKGSAAIQSDKGLYFIKADSAANRKKQLWTQGETQANSAWFPTIDAPNEKMTQEIFLTVDSSMKTLSNGLMLFSTENPGGTRTDFWKMDLPHAPYLAMIAVGDFAVIKDRWEGMEVNYYVDPEYASYAKDIFGNTPEMLAFYSSKLGVKYPWSKYSQIAVHDFVSGAMENTTAVVHGDFIQRTRRELLDKDYEDFIAHELFHHWFGDLVTCESWANLPLNESFATYGEYLWFEYKYGRDEADRRLQSDLKAYFTEARSNAKKMIRYEYDEAEDLFDRHSYQKGGCILHMLRKYLGDVAFFESLEYYLKEYQYETVEIHQLRQAFEKITGEDLNWFFDQWFFSSGHPELSITHYYDDSTHQQHLTVEQQQNFTQTPLFRMPVKIDIYVDGKKEQHEIWIREVKETFTFPFKQRPDLVNFDADKALICKKKENKVSKEWAFQYRNAPLYLDRFEALGVMWGRDDSLAAFLFLEALDDPYWRIREKSITALHNSVDILGELLKDKLIQLSQNDPKSIVRKTSLLFLKEHFSDENTMAIQEAALKDSSYSVVAAGLHAIAEYDSQRGVEVAKELEDAANGTIIMTIAELYAKHGGAKENEFYQNTSRKLHGFEQFTFVNSYSDYLKRQNDSIALLGVRMLSELSLREPIWWIRFMMVSSLREQKVKFEKRKEQTEKRLESLEEGSEDRAIYELQMSSSNKILAEIAANFELLKEKEENQKIRSLLEGRRASTEEKSVEVEE